MPEKADCFISVVIPLHEQLADLQEYLQQLHDMLDERYSDFEIVLVRSRRGPLEEKEPDSILKEISSIRLIELSGKPPFEITCAAGLENAIGDVIVLTIANQVPLEVLPTAIRRSLAGTDVLVGVAQQKTSLLYRLGSAIFQRFLAPAIDYRIPKDATPFRVLSRSALNSVLARRRFLHHLFLDISRTGYPTEPFEYRSTHGSLSPVPPKNVTTGIRAALSVLVFNSTRTLRFISLLGIAGSFLGGLISLYALLIKLFKNDVVEGWTTLSLFMSVQFSLVFLILFFYGEYLARMVNEQHEAAEYTVISEQHSSVMIEMARRNVVKGSTTEDADRVRTRQVPE